MVHLPIHLVNEIKLGGPTHIRWMYSTKRNLCFFKGLVRNRFHLEASILEGFVALERVNLCSRYLHAGVKTKFSRYQLKDEQGTETEGHNLSPMFPKFGHSIGREKKRKGNNFHMDLQLFVDIHRYVLFNTRDEKMETFIMEHKIVIDNHSRSNAWIRAQNHSQEFDNWFKEKVKSVVVPEHLRQLAKGPNTAAKRYTSYFINGYRFHTMKRDSQGKTQNYGVTLSATTDSFASARDQNPIDGEVVYYGVIQDIIEIDYWSCFSVALFKCDWFRNEVDEYGLTRVYFNKLCSTEDPFVLASQVHQVFYVEDPIEKDVYYARTKVHVDFFDLEEENCPNIGKHFLGSQTMTLDHRIEYLMLMLISDGQEKMYLVMSFICQLMINIQNIWKKIWTHQKKMRTLMMSIGIGCRQYLVVMKQRESSRIRNKETRATVLAGTLTSLANQKKLLLAKRRKDLLIEKHQHLTDVIEEQDVVESHNPEVGVRIQADLTNNVVQPVEEQLQLNSTALEGYLYLCIIVDSSTKKRQRGQTKMLSVHGRHDRKLIILNKAGQPVGPSNDVVIELSSFLGTLARNATLCPLDIENWKLLGTKHDLWDYTKKMSKANNENRKKLKNPHTVGKKSFALVRKDLEKERETNDTPSPKEFFVVTRKRKPNRSYKDTDEDTTSKIAEMENIEMQQNEDGNETIDAFASVMGSEHLGRLRLYGREVTKTTLKGKVGNFEASSNTTNDLVKKMEDKMLRMEEKLRNRRNNLTNKRPR
ncbi:hypothetical protein MTR67_018086 [Solanum verrucosum]|uniref:DUF4216 domain-containing protein n=1 Tax=Solanum verrucosum TaxID=315347 RepID=A0AAF0QQ46_SOLVR|nr:hypothetical protein MTR67_018086 [Solanum verrucosum]